jgi:DNA-binding IclR family transcriptional regulator
VPAERASSAPQSVTRVIRIVEALCASSRPLSLAELSRALKAPKSSLAALLRGLADADIVIATDGFYRLGPSAFGLGSALMEARRRVQTPDLLREGMRRLAERCGETVLFAVRDEDGVSLTYVDVIESRNAVRFAVSVGDHRPLYCTAGGRILLSAENAGELRRYLDNLKPRRITSQTETGKRKLGEIIAAAREAGVAQTIDQSSDGVAGTAALIRGANGLVIGALIVAAPTWRVRDGAALLARQVKDEAATISRSLGYRADTAPKRVRNHDA